MESLCRMMASHLMHTRPPFSLAKAETKPQVEPIGIADNFRRKSITVIAECFGFHHANPPKASVIDNTTGLPLACRKKLHAWDER